MRIVELIYTPDVPGRYKEHPTTIRLGSNIRGRRFIRGSAFIEPDEIQRELRTGHLDSVRQLLYWLQTLDTCYKK